MVDRHVSAGAAISELRAKVERRQEVAEQNAAQAAAAERNCVALERAVNDVRIMEAKYNSYRQAVLDIFKSRTDGIGGE